MCEQVRAVVRPLVLTDGDIARLVETFEVETRQGLSGDPDERAMTSLQMGNTHVRRLLNGTGGRRGVAYARSPTHTHTCTHARAHARAHIIRTRA